MKSTARHVRVHLSTRNCKYDARKVKVFLLIHQKVSLDFILNTRMTMTNRRLPRFNSLKIISVFIKLLCHICHIRKWRCVILHELFKILILEPRRLLTVNSIVSKFLMKFSNIFELYNLYLEIISPV